MESVNNGVPSGPRGPVLLVVIVLYRQKLAESLSFLSSEGTLTARPELRSLVNVLLYDNSPDAQAISSFNLNLYYVHNASNGGLRAAYDEALVRAVPARIPWILLLDQDTQFGGAFLLELIALLNRHDTDSSLAAIVPHLQSSGTHISPGRVRFGRSTVPLIGFSGIPPFQVMALIRDLRCALLSCKK